MQHINAAHCDTRRKSFVMNLTNNPILVSTVDGLLTLNLSEELHALNTTTPMNNTTMVTPLLNTTAEMSNATIVTPLNITAEVNNMTVQTPQLKTTEDAQMTTSFVAQKTPKENTAMLETSHSEKDTVAISPISDEVSDCAFSTLTNDKTFPNRVADDATTQSNNLPRTKEPEATSRGNRNRTVSSTSDLTDSRKEVTEAYREETETLLQDNISEDTTIDQENFTEVTIQEREKTLIHRALTSKEFIEGITEASREEVTDVQTSNLVEDVSEATISNGKNLTAAASDIERLPKSTSDVERNVESTTDPLASKPNTFAEATNPAFEKNTETKNLQKTSEATTFSPEKVTKDVKVSVSMSAIDKTTEASSIDVENATEMSLLEQETVIEASTSNLGKVTEDTTEITASATSSIEECQGVENVTEISYSDLGTRSTDITSYIETNTLGPGNVSKTSASVNENVI
ncbi:uncharacterized protein LOC119582342 [Penaeus monodon]|uniref:uncharacterized protein LOC119582342 n=1 Tax=Penaeus monodon TaxID=6687 RepID=UPI0018A6DF1A|nr:uncharacterized protein LOC119582342 [Penaeus monodon]